MSLYSLEWKSDGVTDDESGDDDDNEVVSVKWDGGDWSLQGTLVN